MPTPASSSSRRSHLSRPLPRLNASLPPPSTVYVVERLGRFSRLFYSPSSSSSSPSASPLLPLVDKVIAAYTTRRVRQHTQAPGIEVVLMSGHRVHLSASWQIKLSDAKKLAYRIDDVDRRIDGLVTARIREQCALVQHPSNLQTIAQLESLARLIRIVIDDTAVKFGVRCPSFDITSATPVHTPTATPKNSKPKNPNPKDRSPNNDMRLTAEPIANSASKLVANSASKLVANSASNLVANSASNLVAKTASKSTPSSAVNPIPNKTSYLGSSPSLSFPSSLPASVFPAPEVDPVIVELPNGRLQPLSQPPTPLRFPMLFRQLPPDANILDQLPTDYPQPVEHHLPNQSERQPLNSFNASLNSDPANQQSNRFPDAIPRSTSFVQQRSPFSSSLPRSSSPLLLQPQNPHSMPLTSSAHHPPPQFPILHWPHRGERALDSRNAQNGQLNFEPRSSQQQLQNPVPPSLVPTPMPATHEMQSATRQQKPQKEHRPETQQPRDLQRPSQSNAQSGSKRHIPLTSSNTTRHPKILRAPPPSPTAPSSHIGTQEAFPVLLQRVLASMQASDLEESDSANMQTRVRQPGQLPPNFAKYLHELPATPANQLFSSESSENIDSTFGKPLPLETALPGLSDQAPTDDEEILQQQPRSAANSARTVVASPATPVFPSVASLSVLAAGAGIIAASQVKQSRNSLEDPPSSIDTQTPKITEEGGPDSNRPTHDSRVNSKGEPMPPMQNASSSLPVHHVAPPLSSKQKAAIDTGSTRKAREQDENDSPREAMQGKARYAKQRVTKPFTSGGALGTEKMDTHKAGAAAAASAVAGMSGLTLNSALDSDLNGASVGRTDAGNINLASHQEGPDLRPGKLPLSKKDSNDVVRTEQDGLEGIASLEMNRELAGDSSLPHGTEVNEGRHGSRDGMTSHFSSQRIHGEGMEEAHAKMSEEQSQPVRRERFLDELDMMHRYKSRSKSVQQDPDDEFKKDGGLEKRLDEVSDVERPAFSGESMYREGDSSRRNTSQSSEYRSIPYRTYNEDESHRERDDDVDDWSSDEMCLDCGEYHSDGEDQPRSHQSSRLRQVSRSRGRSRRPDRFDYNDEESYERHRSSSRSGSTRHNRSVVNDESDDEFLSSSRKGQERSRKSSLRERGDYGKDYSSRSLSKQNRSDDDRRTSSRRHLSSRKSSRDMDGEKKSRSSRSSKPRSKSRRARYEFSSFSAEINYPVASSRSRLKSVYRHRLPETDSGEENPIPWYCEGQSGPDSDSSDYRPMLHGENVGYKEERTGSVNPLRYSSYGRRDQNGRRRRARYDKNVHFLYDNSG